MPGCPQSQSIYLNLGDVLSFTNRYPGSPDKPDPVGGYRITVLPSHFIQNILARAAEPGPTTCIDDNGHPITDWEILK